MKALERYIKKNGKSMPKDAKPFGATKAKGTWKGAKGPQESSQYAEKSGRKIVDDKADFDETDPSTAGIGAYESVRGFGKKKNKQRSYLSES